MDILSISPKNIILSIAKCLGYGDVSVLSILNKYFNRILAMFPIDLSSITMHISMFERYFKDRNNINIVGLSINFLNIDIDLSALIPFLPQIEKLSIDYEDKTNSNFIDIDCLKNCTRLTKLTLEIAVQNYDVLKYCIKLEDLTIRKTFGSIDSILPLCLGLKSLTLIDYFTSLESIASFPFLERITFEDILVSKLPSFAGCPNLREVYISSDPIIDISSLPDCSNLIKLHITNADKNIDFTPLQYCPHLEELLIDTLQNAHYSCQLTTNMFSSSLKKISLSSCLFDDECSFENLPLLVELILDNIRSVVLIPPLPVLNGNNKGIKKLELTNMPVDSLPKVKNAKELKIVHISSCVNLTCIDFISRCPKLVGLFISDCPYINLNTLSVSKGLMELYLHKMEGINCLKFLSHFPLLRNLTLIETTSLLVDFTPIAQCSDLLLLKLVNTKIADVKFISCLKELNVLILKQMCAFDLIPLLDCTSLRKVLLNLVTEQGDREEFLSKAPKTLLIKISNKH